MLIVEASVETVEALHVPFAIAPLVNADNNQHASKREIGNYFDGVQRITGSFTRPPD